MTGRVFLVLLLGMAASAALTQWLAVNERQRTIEQYRDFHALERAEQLIVTADVVPAASRAVYLNAASRGGVRLEASDPAPSGATQSDSARPGAVRSSEPRSGTAQPDAAPSSAARPDRAAQGADVRAVAPLNSTPQSATPLSATAQGAAKSPAPPTEFSTALAQRLGDTFALTPLPERPAACDMPRPPSTVFGSSQWGGACESINVRMHDGQLLRLSVLPPRPPPGRGRGHGHGQYELATLLPFLISIAILAYLVTRMTMRPLKQLAQAAKDLGNDINHPPLALAGASEIRQAGAAFNAMQARIRQHIFQRTQMLAAITHDLQTPLTRLRLRLEKVSDAELQERLIGDLSAMQGMVREGLELARSMDSSEAMQPLDLDSLLDSVCADALDAGQRVELAGQASMTLMGRPLALRRCLVNLIDNAVKYGQRAEVSVERLARAARIRIRDHGPGIAQEELAKVFEPFYRVETSRSRASGGTGLGLTIARNIAEQHGASVALANHRAGGLEVTLLLPEYYAGK